MCWSKTFKGTAHSWMKILSLFTHAGLVPTLYAVCYVFQGVQQSWSESECLSTIKNAYQFFFISVYNYLCIIFHCSSFIDNTIHKFGVSMIFSKDTLNISKVWVKTFIILQRIPISNKYFLFIKECRKKSKMVSTNIMHYNFLFSLIICVCVCVCKEIYFKNIKNVTDPKHLNSVCLNSYDLKKLKINQHHFKNVI